MDEHAQRVVAPEDASRPAVAFVPPPGAVDCHVHVLDPGRHPFSSERAYTPGAATASMLEKVHARLGIDRVVVVQNSVYGRDNACLMDALAWLGPERARGVVVLSDGVTDDEIASLDSAGVRGVRINIAVTGRFDLADAERRLSVARRLPRHWHLELNADPLLVAGLAELIGTLHLPVVLDHYAHIEPAADPDGPAFGAVLALLAAGQVYVKLSAPYQVSRLADYRDLDRLVGILVDAAPDRLVWGSDWPHTGGVGRPADQPRDVLEPFRAEDDAYNLELLGSWIANAELRRRVLVETPSQLYGFGPP